MFSNGCCSIVLESYLKPQILEDSRAERSRIFDGNISVVNTMLHSSFILSWLEVQIFFEKLFFLWSAYMVLPFGHHKHIKCFGQSTIWARESPPAQEVDREFTGSGVPLSSCCCSPFFPKHQWRKTGQPVAIQFKAGEWCHPVNLPGGILHQC